MGFLDKVFGKKSHPEQVPETIELRLPELNEFLEKNFSQEYTVIEKNVFIKFSEVKHLLKQLKDNLDELEKVNVLGTEGNFRLRKIVKTSKKNLLNQMNSLIKKLSPPNKSEFSLLQEYCLNSSKLLQEAVTSFGKNIAYTGIILKNEVKKIGSNVQELNKVFSDLKKLFEENSHLSLVPQTHQIISEFKEKLKEKDESIKKIKLIENEILSLNKLLNEKEKELNNTKTSSKAAELNSLQEKKAALVRKKQEIKSKILNIFSPIEKPLKRFYKLSESKQFILSSEEKSIFHAFLSNPFLALKADPKAATIKKLFSYLQTLIENNTISLKEKEKQKKLESLKKLQSFDFFEKVFWEFNSIEVEIKKIDAEISSKAIAKKISSIEEEIVSINSQIKEKIEELQFEKNSLKKLESALTELKTSIEDSLQKISKKIVSISMG